MPIGASEGLPKLPSGGKRIFSTESSVVGETKGTVGAAGRLNPIVGGYDAPSAESIKEPTLCDTSASIVGRLLGGTENRGSTILEVVEPVGFCSCVAR